MLVWDYFMRRKSFLLALLAFFSVCAVVSGQLLTKSTAYTGSPANREIYIETTNEERIAENSGRMLRVSIATEEKQADLSDSRIVADETMQTPEIAQVDTAEAIEVPLTSVAKEDLALAEKTSKIFSTWRDIVRKTVIALTLGFGTTCVSRAMITRRNMRK